MPPAHRLRTLPAAALRSGGRAGSQRTDSSLPPPWYMSLDACVGLQNLCLRRAFKASSDPPWRDASIAGLGVGRKQPSTRRGPAMRRESSAGNVLLRALLVLAVLAIAFAALSTFWLGSPPAVAVEPAMHGIGKRTALAVKVSDTGRGDEL